MIRTQVRQDSFTTCFTLKYTSCFRLMIHGYNKIHHPYAPTLKVSSFSVPSSFVYSVKVNFSSWYFLCFCPITTSLIETLMDKSYTSPCRRDDFPVHWSLDLLVYLDWCTSRTLSRKVRLPCRPSLWESVITRRVQVPRLSFRPWRTPVSSHRLLRSFRLSGLEHPRISRSVLLV